MVVHGITASGTPTVHFRNPLPDLEGEVGTPIPPHSDRDICKDKDIANCGDRGGESAPCDEWERTLLSRRSTVRCVTSSWSSHQGSRSHPAGATVAVPRDRQIAVEPLSRDMLPRAAWAALGEAGLLAQPEWEDLGNSPRLNDARVITVHNPSDEPYSIVYLQTDGAPQRDDHGHEAPPSVMVRMSASGQFLGALLSPADRLVRGLFGGERRPGDQFVWRYSESTLFSPFVPLLDTPGDIGGRFSSPIRREAIGRFWSNR